MKTLYTEDRIRRAFEILANGQHGYKILDWDHEGFVVCRCREYNLHDGEVDYLVFVKLTIEEDETKATTFVDAPVTRKEFEHAQATWLAEHGMPDDVDKFIIELDRVCFLIHKTTADVRWKKGAEPDA